MPPRRKPHPRSLDALFGPKPRTVAKAAVKRCPLGHRQAATWKAGSICYSCAVAEEERLRDDQPLPPLGPVPEVLRMRVTDTGRLLTFAIPRHMQCRRPRARWAI